MPQRLRSNAAGPLESLVECRRAPAGPTVRDPVRSPRPAAAAAAGVLDRSGRSCRSAGFWASFHRIPRQKISRQIGELQILRVLFRDLGLTNPPGDIQIGIVPKNAVLVAWVVIVAAFVQELDRI